MVPVCVRADDERGALGNRVAAMLAPLPVGEDPVERLRSSAETMGDLEAAPARRSAPSRSTELTDFAPPTIARQAARLQSRQRFFNLVVTNVPGPQFPLYLLGRRMTSTLPARPARRRQALCVGIMSATTARSTSALPS